MNDVVYKCLCMFTRIPQILHDVIARIAQNPHIVKIFTIFEKLQNGYNGYNVSR